MLQDPTGSTRWAEASGPLRGVRIVDLTTMASGPLATTILGDQGADVIKVEAPGTGDLLRRIGVSRSGLSAIFNTINRSKRSIVIDLKNASGLDLLEALVATADVLVENFRPGTAARMGIDLAALRRRNPRLVTVSISGFGEVGPLADRPVYDSVMQAYAGFASSQADPESGDPGFVRNIVCDKGTALTVAQAITSALFAREQSGRGQHVTLSMLHASVAFLWPDAMQGHTYIDPEETGGRPAARAGLPVVRATADGWITFTAVNDDEFVRLCRALECEALVSDPRFAQASERTMHSAELHEILAPLSKKRTTADLQVALERERVPHAVINELEALHEDPQIQATGILVEQDHPHAGRQRQPRPVPGFETTPAAIQRPAPMLGEHGDEILEELGFDESERAQLLEDGVVVR